MCGGGLPSDVIRKVKQVANKMDELPTLHSSGSVPCDWTGENIGVRRMEVALPFFSFLTMLFSGDCTLCMLTRGYLFM